MSGGKLSCSEGAIPGRSGVGERPRRWKRPHPAIPLLVLLSACGAASDSGDSAAAAGEAPSLQRVTAPAGEHLERFGAAIAADGNVAVVGAWGNSLHGEEAGAAYVYLFHESTASWELDRATLTPDVATPGSRFGHSVAIAEDVVAVGAIYDPTRGERAGAVHLFERTSDGWSEREKLLPAAGSDDVHFGTAIAIEGETLVVSAAGPADPRVHIYQRILEEWELVATIAPPPRAAGKYFGSDLALRGDWLVIGAPDREGARAGSVYLFGRSGEGWSERGSLEGSNGEPYFGAVVDLAPTGLLAVGAPGVGEDGAVYLHDLSEAGAPQGQVLRPEASAQPHFGTSLMLAGEWLAVGSPGASHGSFASGKVQLFRPDGPSGAWRFVRELGPPSPGDDMAFGIAVAASADHLVIGASGDSEGGSISGSVYTVSWRELGMASP
jgi:hypothetical protein